MQKWQIKQWNFLIQQTLYKYVGCVALFTNLLQSDFDYVTGLLYSGNCYIAISQLSTTE